MKGIARLETIVFVMIFPACFSRANESVYLFDPATRLRPAAGYGLTLCGSARMLLPIAMSSRMQALN
jgi:hypothetical protein